MSRLLRFELHKIIKQKALYICVLINIALGVAGIFIQNASSSPEWELAPGEISFMVGALSSSQFDILMGIFIAIYLNEDISNNTMKNIYSKGYSRLQVYLAKYIASALTAVLWMMACFIFTYMAGRGFASGSMSPEGNIALNMLAQCVLFLGYHAIFFVVNSICGRLSFNVVFNIYGPYVFVSLLDFAVTYVLSGDIDINKYWIENNISSLSGGDAGAGLISDSFTKGILYIAVFLFVGMYFSRKKEV